MKFLKITLGILIGGVLFVAAIGKLLDNRHFAEALAAWRIFPRWSLLPLGVLASLLELVLAAWLFSNWRLPQAALAAVIFHLGYFVATVIALLRGIRLPDCGCFGILFPHPLNWAMAFEDFGFAMLSFALYFLAKKR
ncbi:MAG TPA: MauE/DoxX family redox-associated membrane protein [Chthoniobacterales bacterium]|nr:MauE/DoxX family redox-associated membrane protein [Chthoniobacterales bacterium]